MAYKIPNIPSKRSHKEEKADFWEIESIRNPDLHISQTHVLKAIGIEFDETNNDGIDSEEDELATILEDVYSELCERTRYSDDTYPFAFGRYSLKLNDISSDEEYLYVYLLLCTRFNMKDDKIQAEIDGALLFEEICAVVAEKFFGKNAKGIVFGTAAPGGFPEKVKNLIRQLGEGDKYQDPNKSPTSKNDDSVDVVVWKDFADKKIGKLIGFGQCKTGTSWRNKIKELRPDFFCTTWFRTSPILDPIPMVFLADTMNEERDDYTSQRGYLVFNRFRILEYAKGNLTVDLNSQVKTWVDTALTKIDRRL